MPRPHTPSQRTRRRRWAWALTITAALLAVVWVVSMKTDVIVAPTPQLAFGWHAGCVGVVVYDRPYPAGFNASFPARTSPTIEGKLKDGFHTDWWFDWNQDRMAFVGRWFVSIPLWPFVLLTGVPGVWLLVKTRARPAANQCAHCGYDRTGLPAPAPCPECGKG